MQLYVDMQLTIASYIACIYAYIHIANITDFLPLHVAHISLLYSLFTMGLCIPKEDTVKLESIVLQNLLIMLYALCLQFIFLIA